MFDIGGYVNGFIQRRSGGKYQGDLIIDGVALDGGIDAQYFTLNHKNYLWIKRKPIMQYDFELQQYTIRKRKPYFECYLEKQIDNNVVAYKGKFTFLRFNYSIIGVWDKILGKDLQRLNLYVERMPMKEQTILNSINERKRNDGERREDNTRLGNDR